MFSTSRTSSSSPSPRLSSYAVWMMLVRTMAFSGGGLHHHRGRMAFSTGGLHGRTGALRGSSEELCTIKFETADGIRIIEGVRRGELVRSALLKRGVSPHNKGAQTINCRGLGTCGTCAVDIDGEVTPRTNIERTRLSLPPHTNPSLRLACQCRVHGDLVIRKYDGFWGHKADLAPSQWGRPVLGDLEYLMDPDAANIVCGVCGGTETVSCPNCGGRGKITATTGETDCPACDGTGLVLCRSCFKLDPFDLDAVRQAATDARRRRLDDAVDIVVKRRASS